VVDQAAPDASEAARVASPSAYAPAFARVNWKFGFAREAGLPLAYRAPLMRDPDRPSRRRRRRLV
jgi:hypothetical protein